MEDSSQLFLRSRESRQICTQFGEPTFDLFAGPNEGEHKCEKYFSLFGCPGSYGVDAMRHPGLPLSVMLIKDSPAALAVSPV